MDQALRAAGATVLGVHSPGFSFGKDEATVRAAVKRLDITHPILLDPEFELWQTFGNRGWPARYLFGRGGYLRYFHYGEGDYEECELTLQEVLREFDPEVELAAADGAAAPRGRARRRAARPRPPTSHFPDGADRLKVKGTWEQRPRTTSSPTKAGNKVSVKCDAGAA